MVSINESDHVFGMAIMKIFTPFLEEEKFQKKIQNWNKIIVVELKGIYTFSLIFDNGVISCEYGDREKHNLKLITTFDAFVGIAEGYTGLIPAFIRGKIKVKKIYNIFTVLKFITILLPALKRATAEPIAEGYIKVF
jgi:putative sterol carrier protein